MKENQLKLILNNRNFLKIWASQLLSQITTSSLNFLLILTIYEHTHSGLMVALVAFFYAIPTVLLGPFSGVIVDLIDKRKILFWTNLAQAIIILFYLGVKNQIWPIYSIILLYSLVNQFYTPAESASLPLLVSKKFYPLANSIFLFTINGTFLIGYSLTGPMIRLLGRDLPFFLYFFFLILATIAVYLLPKNYSPIPKKSFQFNDFFNRLAEGYQFIKKNRLILYPLLLIIMAQIYVSLMIIVVPIYSEKILKINLLDSALILITPAGLGALIGVRLIIRKLANKVRKIKIIIDGLILNCLGFYLLSLIIPYFPIGKIELTALVCFFLGVGFSLTLIPTQTLIQENTPKELLGRVYGTLSFVITLAALLPLILTATLVDLFGIKLVLFILASFIFMMIYTIYQKRTLLKYEFKI